MDQQPTLREDEARQIAEETAVIDHLVQTFPFGKTAPKSEPYVLRSGSVFARIRNANDGKP